MNSDPMPVGEPDPEPDSDVVTGFPVKRLALTILYANMMFVGCCVVLEAALVAFISYEDRDSPEEFFAEMSAWTVELTETLVEVASNDWLELAYALVPGTIIGLVWYFIRRWREGVLVKKRRQALLAKQRESVIS